MGCVRAARGACGRQLELSQWAWSVVSTIFVAGVVSGELWRGAWLRRVRTVANRQLASTAHLLCGFLEAVRRGRLVALVVNGSILPSRNDEELVGCGRAVLLTIVQAPGATAAASLAQFRHPPQLFSRTGASSPFKYTHLQ